jgi:hypothetical protein
MIIEINVPNWWVDSVLKTAEMNWEKTETQGSFTQVMENKWPAVREAIAYILAELMIQVADRQMGSMVVEPDSAMDIFEQALRDI